MGLTWGGGKCPLLVFFVYKTIIRPAVTYGAEIWTLTSKTEKNVNDMGEKDIEENIWINKGKWTVEN
jgi:hypothetical protein